MSDALARRSVLRHLVAMAAAPVLGACRGSGSVAEAKENRSMSSEIKTGSSGRLPVLFVGHGSPMNAIEDNRWSRAFRELGKVVPKPRAILAVSAHWFVPGTFLTSNDPPETIHDFGGFPQHLYDMQYPAHGDRALADKVAGLLGETASLRSDWGLDHGTWSVLHHLRPNADVPVVQLSIDHRLPPAAHLALGKKLAPLREDGVLVFASGNVTHNLRHAMVGMRTGNVETPDWAGRFDGEVKSALEQHDGDALARVVGTDYGRMSHPSPDHYYPLLYAAGAAADGDRVSFPITGFDLGSLSMRSVLWS